MRTTSLFARVLLVGCLGLFVAGCTTPAPSSDSSSGSAPAGTTAAEAPAASGGGGWMEGIPSTVPKFESGTFDDKQSSKITAGEQTIYSLYSEDAKKEDVEAYIEKLQAAGFEMTADNVTSGVSAAGQLKKGEEILVGLSIAWQEGGHIDYTINVQKAGEE